MENQALTQYGFEDDERYRKERRPEWVRRSRRRNQIDHLNGQALRCPTDDPDDIQD